MTIFVKCFKCHISTAFKQNVPARLTCSKCGSNSVQFLSDDQAATIVDLECHTCQERKVIKLGEEFEVLHDKSNCKSLTWIINPVRAKVPVAPISAPKNDFLVSVIVLCHNQVEITKTCIEHLRKSTVKVKIILVDNGSTDGTVEWAKGEIGKEDFLYIRNQINLGCCIGRNQGARWANTEYIMFLDNDQFVSSVYINDCLEKKKDLVGLELWEIVSDGGVSKQHDDLIKRNSYIGSGGMLIKKRVFDVLKGYDERFAPAWYEDVDFFFRAKAAGYSYAVLRDKNVVHLGGITDNNQKTFNLSEAKTNGRKLFVQIWSKFLNNVSINSRVNSQSLSSHVIGSNLPKILMCADVSGWAWDYKATKVKEYLKDSFNIDIMYINENGSALKKKYDVIFFFESYKGLDPFNSPWVTGVTAHTYPRISGYPGILKEARAIHANSKLLFEEIEKYNKKCFYLPNGVDHRTFPFRSRKNRKNFVVGYVGKDTPRKGFHEYIEPACRIAGVQLKTAIAKFDSKNRISYADMPSFYEDVDVIMVASDMDGTPNQLLEAAATGRSCIGNRIGNIPEFITDGVNGFIVERKIEAYVEKINYLKNNRDACIAMGKKARETVESGWTWEMQAKNYEMLFRDVLLTT